MIHVKLTSIPPPNRKHSGKKAPIQPPSLIRPAWRVISRDVLRDGLLLAVEQHIDWIRAQIGSATDEQERLFWEEALRRLLGE